MSILEKGGKVKEPIHIRFLRHLLKPLTLFVPRRSVLGRMLRTRGCKKLPSVKFLKETIERAVAIVDGFDPQVDVLFIGSSHIQKNIAPAVFKKLQGWNAGVSSGDMKMSVEIYRALRERWPKSKGQCVVLAQDFWLPSSQAEYTFEYIQTVILHELIGMCYRSSLWTRHAGAVCRKIIEQVRQNESWKKLLKYRGLEPMPSEEGRVSKSLLQDRVLGHLQFLSFKPTELGWFKELKSMVADDGRTLILLRPPHREDYLEILDENPLSKRLWDVFDSVVGATPIIDLFRHPIPLKGWNDADHLSEIGATIFTELLEPKLIKLLLQKSSE
jgi:hypothetical protein